MCLGDLKRASSSLPRLAIHDSVMLIYELRMDR